MTMTIYPYLLQENCWVFDDEATGLKQEAFVMGASEMITALLETKNIPHAADGFQMTFSDQPFDGVDVQLELLGKGDHGPMTGNWYRGQINGQEMECWLCPALFCFFDSAPHRLFVKADQLPAGIDPIWHVEPNDPRQRRFVGPDE